LLRGRDGFVSDLGQDANKSLEIARWNGVQQFVSQLAGGVVDLMEKSVCLGLQVNSFAASIVAGIFAFDPALAFQASEETGEGRLFDAEPFGEVSLGEMTASEESDGAPFRLAQTERL
jgi:hypothetical protein